MKNDGTNTTQERPQGLRAFFHGAKLAEVSFSLLVFCVVLGIVVGIVLSLVLHAINITTDFIWGTLGSHFSKISFLPIIICTIGGLVIGLWEHAFHDSPAGMEEVMAEVKSTGGYSYKGFWKSCVAALLPLMFGGSLGPEAGLTGIIASACTFVGDMLKKAGARLEDVSSLGIIAALTTIFATPFYGVVFALRKTDSVQEDDPAQTTDDEADGEILPAGQERTSHTCTDDEGDVEIASPSDPSCGDKTEEAAPESPRSPAFSYPKKTKIVLYLAVGFGSLAGFQIISLLLGPGLGLPYFADIHTGLRELLWFVPLALIGTFAGMLWYTSYTLCDRIVRPLEKMTVLKPVIGGALLGISGTFLPYTMFPGEAQATIVMESWQSMGALVLILTGFIKMILSPLCLSFGWKGGTFFPAIFAGMCLGYGFSLLTGADPLFCVAAIDLAIVGSMLRSPLLTVALMMLCFPPSHLVVLVAAAVIGSYIPVPPAIAAHVPERKKGNLKQRMRETG